MLSNVVIPSLGPDQPFSHVDTLAVHVYPFDGLGLVEHGDSPSLKSNSANKDTESKATDMYIYILNKPEM